MGGPETQDGGYSEGVEGAYERVGQGIDAFEKKGKEWAKAFADIFKKDEEDKKAAEEEKDAGPGFFGKHLEKLKKLKEEGKEVIDQYDNLSAITEVQDYFEDHEADLRSMGAMDVISDPNKVSTRLREARNQLQKASAAVKRVQKSKLRFSREYIGPTIDRLNQQMDALSDDTVKVLEKASKVSDKMEDVHIEIKLLQKQITVLRKRLDGLVDEKLSKEGRNSNNYWLEQALEADELAEKAKRKAAEGKEWVDDKTGLEEKRKDYERLKKIIEIVDKVEKYL